MAQKRIPTVDGDGRLFSKHMPTYLTPEAIQALTDRFKSGTVNPEGNVSGPLGARYFHSGSSGLNGRREWVKTTSAGNTGWVLVNGLVEYDITSLFSRGVTINSPIEDYTLTQVGGTVKIRRNLNVVSLKFDQFTWYWNAPDSDDYAYARIPLTFPLDMTGFDPHVRMWFDLDYVSAGFTQPKVAKMFYRDITNIPDGATTGDKSFNLMSLTEYRNGTGNISDGNDAVPTTEALYVGQSFKHQLNGEIRWSTTDDWPTAAPSAV